MVVDAAFEIARRDGMEQVLVKNIADRLGCSVQPIYSYCKNMEGLREDVTGQVRRFIREYVSDHIDSNDLFRSTGRAYVQLAKEEPHLFRIFILQRRRGISSLNDLYQAEAGVHIAEGIADKLHIDPERAKQLMRHLGSRLWREISHEKRNYFVPVKVRSNLQICSLAAGDDRL